MAENDSVTGLAITIPEEVFTDLNRLEKKIMGLGTITNNISGNIVASFLKMANGVDPFIKKVGEAEVAIERLGSIGFSSGSTASTTSIEKTTSAIVETANALNRTDFSANIENAHKRLQTLIGDLKIYEEYLNTPNDANQAFAAEGIEQTSKEIREIIAVIPELEKLQSVLSRNDLFQNYIDGLNGATIEARRQKSEMSQLNEYYRELEKSSAQAAKAQERASNQAAKAQERQRKEQEKLLAAQQKAYRETPKGAMDFAASATTYNQRAQAMKYLDAAIKNLDKTSKDYQQTLLRLSSRYKTLKDEQDAVSRSMGTLQQSQHNLMDISGQLMRRLALVFSVSQVTQYVQKLAQVRGEFELQNAALAAIMQNKDEADQLFSQITQLAVQSPFQLKELVTYTKELAAYRVENEKLFDTTKMLADVSAGLGVDMSRLILAYGQVKAANYLRGTELRQFSEAGINILGELATYFSEIENRAVSVGEVFDMVSRRMVSFQDVEKIFQRITSEGGIFANMQEVQSRTLAGMISNLQDSVDIMLNDIGQESEGALKGAVNLMRELVENWRTVAAIGKGVLIPLLSYKALMTTIVFLNKQYNKMQTMHISLLRLIVSWKKKEALAQAGLNAAAKANPYILLASVIIGTITAIVTAIRNANREQEEFNRTLTEGATKATELSANFERLANIAVSDSSSAEEQNAAMAEMNRTYEELIPSQYRNIEALKKMNGDYTAVTNAINDKIAAQTQEKLTQDALTNSADKTNGVWEKLNTRLQKVGVSSETSMKVIREFKRQLDEGLIPSQDAAYDSFINLLSQYTGQDFSKYFNFGNINKSIRTLYDETDRLKDKLEEIKNMDFSSWRAGGGTAMYKSLNESLEGIVASADEYKKRLQENDSLTFKYSIELDEAAKDAQIKDIEFFRDQLKRQIKEGIIDKKDVASVENVIDDARKAIEKIRISDRIDEIQDLRVEISKLTGIDFGKLNITQMLPTESDAEYIKKVQQEVNSMKEVTDFFDEAAAKGEIIPQMQQDSLIGIGNTIENYTKTYQALRAFLERIAFTPDETKKGGKDDNEEKYKTWISLLKEVNKEYENLLKEFNAEDAKSKIELAYQDTFTGADIGNLIGTMEFDASGIIEQLKKMMGAVPDEYKQLFRKALDNLETEIGIDVNIKNRKAIEDEMSDIISDYNISMEFSKIGGTPEMSTLLGFDYTTLDDVTAYVQGKRKELIEKGGEENLKLAEKLQKDYSDLEIRQLRENSKKYLEYLNESKNERLKIEEDYQRRLAELQDTKLTDDQKRQATANLTQERDRKLAEYDWNQFRDTDLYRNAFEDLERVGTRTLDILIRRLEEFAKANASAMSTEDFREYMNTLKQVRTELESRNPWKTLVNYIRQYKDATQDLRNAENDVISAQSDVDSHIQEKAAAQEEVDSAQADYDKAQSLEERVAALERLVAAQSRLETANTALEASMDNLKEAEDKVTSAENSQQEAASGLSNILGEISSQYNTMVNSINGVIDAVLELADGLGIALDDETSAAIEGFQKGFSVLGTIMSALIPIITAITVSGTAMQAALWPLLVIGAALGAIFAIVAAHDAARQKVIDAEQDKIDRLQDSYDEITESLDKALTTSDLVRYNQQLTQNMQQQQAAYDKMIAAEKDKKNPDEEQIANWEKESADLTKQYGEDLEAALVQAGGIARDEYLSQAQDFVDAWVDAFQETGNGLSGLEDNFEEFFMNVLKQQAAMAISQKFIQPIIDDLNSALDDYELDDKEAQNLYNNAMATMPELSKFLEEWFKPFLGMIGDTEEVSLSGLQKGIQGVTEETAQIIEALLNSMRYYVADTNAKLNSIYLMLSGTEGVPNPMLVELRAQTEQLRAINRLIRNVTASGHPNGGDGIKIFMN